MLISQKQLEALAAKQQLKADRAYNRYQETGIPRYDRERRNAEDLADALRVAANAADEHLMLGNLRAELIWHAGQAEAALAVCAPRDKLAEILEQIIDSAAALCNYARRESGQLERQEEES